MGMISAPYNGYMGSSHINEYMRNEYKKKVYRKLIDDDSVYQCMQEAGDVMYLGNYWEHGVINLEPGIAFAASMPTHRFRGRPMMQKFFFRPWVGHGLEKGYNLGDKDGHFGWNQKPEMDSSEYY